MYAQIKYSYVSLNHKKRREDSQSISRQCFNVSDDKYRKRFSFKK